MTRSLEGKVAVVTGGSRGIGKAVCQELIARGAKVVIGDILEEVAQATVNEFNEKAGTKVATQIRTDVVKYSDNIALFKHAEQEFGGVDIAFLNAGIGNNSNTIFLPLEDELDDRMLDINTMGVIKGTKVAVLHMAKRGGGVIVNTASMAGLVSTPSLSIYNASKHAVVGWTRSFQLLPAVCNVRVNAICPYWVETDIVAALSDRAKADPFDRVVSQSKRTKIETVVEAVLKLIEDETINAATYLALPEGVIRPQEVQADFPEIIDEKFVAAQTQYMKEDAVAFYKEQLDQALKRYNP